jgi:hypothetical protein
MHSRIIPMAWQDVPVMAGVAGVYGPVEVRACNLSLFFPFEAATTPLPRVLANQLSSRAGGGRTSRNADPSRSRENAF